MLGLSQLSRASPAQQQDMRLLESWEDSSLLVHPFRTLTTKSACPDVQLGLVPVTHKGAGLRSAWDCRMSRRLRGWLALTKQLVCKGPLT